MLKIYFSSEDILRTRVAPAADPVWELVLSLHLLQGRSRDPLMAGWRRDVSGGLRRDSGLRPAPAALRAEPAPRLLPRLPHPVRRAWRASAAGLDARPGHPDRAAATGT